MLRRRRIINHLIVPLLILTESILFAAMAPGKEVLEMDSFSISSKAFKHGEPIPARFSCDGSDISPPLQIGAPPPNTTSLALIMDDPDAPVGTWVHWVVWNIPTQTRDIAENTLPAGAIQGENSWKRNNYGGPCPPSGTHRYFFKIYALDRVLDLDQATTKKDLERAIQGHILAKGELMGTYRRN
jgi:Raf kinase inhibitor-like YbhB/YbcL family protein